MISTSSTTTTMELELQETNIDAGKDVIKRLTDILSGMRMQKEQLELHSNTSDGLYRAYPQSVSATILGVPQRQETDLGLLTELIGIGVDALNVLRIHDAASKDLNDKQKKKRTKTKKGEKDESKRDIFDGYLNLAVVYIATGLERRDIRNFRELMTYVREELGNSPTRVGHICFTSPPGPATVDESPTPDALSRDVDGDGADPSQTGLKRSATTSEREASKTKKKTKVKKKKDILRIRTVSTWWAGGKPQEVTFGTFTDAATTAALFLLSDAWGISPEDLLILCQSNLRSVPLEDQYLIDEAQSRRDRHQSLNSRYVNHPSYNLRGSAGSRENAICFSYPEAPPQFSSDLLMSVYQPHAAPPTRFGYAVWGSSAMIRPPRRSTTYAMKSDDPTPYKGVMILPDATVMEKHVRMLRDMARQQVEVDYEPDPDGKEMEPVFLTWLKTHWIHAAAPTLVAETQSVLRALSEAPLWLERIRFESTTGASSGRANYLLMLYHHFRQSAFLAKKMKTQIDELRVTIPPSSTAGLQSTGWLASISDDCDFWFNECDRLCKDTGLLRRFVLEQRELTQSTRGFVLTILASIFIPLSFVATFFGMNTVEINSPQSNWRLKYYFYSAVPLVIATVFTPFIVPPALRWAVRSGAKFDSRPVAKFVVIVISLVYFLASDIICQNIFDARINAMDKIDWTKEDNSAAIDAIDRKFLAQVERCWELSAFNFWFRILIAAFAIGFCWFEVDHRRTIDPSRKTRPWPVSVAIAHFRYREGWKRMYLYYLTSLGFTVSLATGVPYIYLVPYAFYFWKVIRRAFKKYRRQREQKRISKRVKDMEIEGNIDRSL